jgi:hypothetical protein
MCRGKDLKGNEGKWPQDWWIVTKEVEHATVAFLEEPQNIEEALTCENSKEWECVM